MKPALSLVFFTVLSGAGFGLAAMLAAIAPGLTDTAVQTAAVLSLTLVAAGLGASALHLANPKNAWRAVMRVRTSWLSREAVLAALFFPLTLAYLVIGDAAQPLLRALIAGIAVLTVYCTAMIYQSLKTIAQWHHPATAFNYLALALMSGGVLLTAIAAAAGSSIGATVPNAALIAAAIFTAAAAAGKLHHYRRIGACKDISVGHATGFSQARARLLDAGHTGHTFLTREFIYQQPATTLTRRRRAALALTFPAAAAALAAAAAEWHSAIIALLTLPMFAGLLLERWLFFAEAHHSVRAYHGEAQ